MNFHIYHHVVFDAPSEWTMPTETGSFNTTQEQLSRTAYSSENKGAGIMPAPFS